MPKYFITVETERTYEHFFEADNYMDAKEYVEQYLLEDDHLVYQEVTGLNWTSLEDEDAGYQ